MHFVFRAMTSMLFERRLPWRMKQWISRLRINNIRFIITRIAFLITPPRLRVLVSSHYFGGIGGSEKHLASLVDSMPDVEFHIISEELNHRGFLPRKFNHYVVTKARTDVTYDMYFYFCGGGKPPYVGNDYQIRHKMVVTNAARIVDIEDKFDYIAIQSENYPMFCTQHDKCIRAFPDVEITLPRITRAVPGLPDRFLITVFNPFSKTQKRHHLIYELAQHSKLPIVWCYNDTTGIHFGDIPETDNVIQLQNLSQEELYYAYQHAEACISFSSYESFGWSLAEAYFLNKPIISRKTGIMDYVVGEPGIYIYESDEQLQEILEKCDFATPQYDHRMFLDNSYAKVFARLCSRTT